VKRPVGVALLAVALTASAAPRPVDTARSELAFSIKQMGVPVTGVFKRFKAAITLDPAHLESASAQVDVDVGSLSTGADEADDTARDKAWLDAQAFPKATFASTAVKAVAAGKYEAAGRLTLKGKTRDVKVPFTFAAQPDGTGVAAGEFVIHRTDFGIGGGEWNQGDLVANEATVRFRIALGAPR